MEGFDVARLLYRDGKELLDATRSLAAAHDALRWAREDLEEDLLDLKLAVVEQNRFELPRLLTDVRAALAEVFHQLTQIDPEEFNGD